MWQMQIKWMAISALTLVAVVLSAFQKEDGMVGLDYPQSWPEPVYDFSRNPLSTEGIALGRKLFYDPNLSADGVISCANCHLSYTAFTHVDHALSHGINDSIGTRNSMALTNLAWSTSFMWDGAVNHLDMQALAPIGHPAEMGSDIVDVVEKLKASSDYQTRFEKAFPQAGITGETVLKAFAQFQLTLVTSNSKYDRVVQGEEHFTAQEKQGYKLFQSHCSSCHVEPLFTNYTFTNNGLPRDPFLQDLGRMGVTLDSSDSLKFKVPSLRNIEFSHPYMHDGRFEKLSDVLNHYVNGVKQSQTLATELKDGINLSSNDKVDLIAFLLTLSDKEFLFNPNHAFPRE